MKTQLKELALEILTNAVEGEVEWMYDDGHTSPSPQAVLERLDENVENTIDAFLHNGYSQDVLSTEFPDASRDDINEALREVEAGFVFINPFIENPYVKPSSLREKPEVEPQVSAVYATV